MHILKDVDSFNIKGQVKSRTFHYPRPKKITEFWPMKGLERIAPITWEIPPP